MCLEESLVNHGSPTLAGIKVASLYSFFPEDELSFPRQYKQLRAELHELGLELVILRKCPRNGSLLLYVYRPSALARELERPEVCAYLTRAGYRLESGLSVPQRCRRAVAQLALRLRMSAEFPHEIGLFLGYPLEDVEGFVANRGENYLCRGLWKVYGNPDAACAAFRRFRLCTEDYRHRYAAGAALVQLIVPAS